MTITKDMSNKTITVSRAKEALAGWDGMSETPEGMMRRCRALAERERGE